MRFQACNNGGKHLSLRTARPDCASEACRRQTKVTYVIAHRLKTQRGIAEFEVNAQTTHRTNLTLIPDAPTRIMS